MIERSIGSASVSAIALGTAGLSIADPVVDPDADATIDAAVEAGVTFVDTAAAYATATDARHSERLVRRALDRHPGLFVATKGGHTRDGVEWGIDGRPESIRRDCERSLGVLGLERLDLYYLHKPDPEADFLDGVGALAALQREGKIARIGLSNVSPDQLAAARQVAQIDAVQNRFSPLDTADLECLRLCERLGIAYLPYSPLGGASAALESAFPLTLQCAAERDASLRSVLLAWLLSLSTTVIPVVGARRPASIADSARAADIRLDVDLAAAIADDRIALDPGSNLR